MPRKVPLKTFLLALMDERDRMYESQFSASKEAVLKAERAVESRLASMNEFRQQMNDMQTTLARKSEVDIRFDALEKRVDSAFSQLQLNKGRETGIGIAWSVVIALIGIAIGVGALVLAGFRAG